MATPGPQRNRMDKLLEILNSMRSNSSGVEAQLASFMEEAHSSTQSEETLGEIAHTIYSKAVRDRGFAATAAKLCYKMALFMVEGTKFRSLLLNMLQVRSHVRRTQVFISFPGTSQCRAFHPLGSKLSPALTHAVEMTRQFVHGEDPCAARIRHRGQPESDSDP